MDNLKERLYETIDVTFEGGELPQGICDLDQIRLARASDGSIRLYFDDCLGLARIDLTAEDARTLLGQLAEALREEKPNPVYQGVLPQTWGTGISSSQRCPACGKWYTGYHLCVTC